MTRIEALRAELKCREMVLCTELEWWEVVRLDGVVSNYPDFSYPAACYTFAIGIVEGKPVWEGDKLYGDLGESRLADNYMIFPGTWSWHPPKQKTVMIELPIYAVQELAKLIGHEADFLNIAGILCRTELDKLK